jgi:hypothetical protein
MAARPAALSPEAINRDVAEFQAALKRRAHIAVFDEIAGWCARFDRDLGSVPVCLFDREADWAGYRHDLRALYDYLRNSRGETQLTSEEGAACRAIGCHIARRLLELSQFNVYAPILFLVEMLNSLQTDAYRTETILGFAVDFMDQYESADALGEMIDPLERFYVDHIEKAGVTGETEAAGGDSIGERWSGEQRRLVLQSGALSELVTRAAQAEGRDPADWLEACVRERLGERHPDLLEELDDRAHGGERAGPSPEDIPEYRDRAKSERRWGVVEFIKQKFGPWLDGSFTRADLRKGWPRTRQTLANYERRHGRVPLEELFLPSRGEKHQMAIERGRLEYLKNKDWLSREERREMWRLERHLYGESSGEPEL